MKISGKIFNYDTPDKEGNVFKSGCIDNHETIAGVPILNDFNANEVVGIVESAELVDGGVQITGSLVTDDFYPEKHFLSVGVRLSNEHSLAKPIEFTDCEVFSVAVTANPLDYGTELKIND